MATEIEKKIRRILSRPGMEQTIGVDEIRELVEGEHGAALRDFHGSIAGEKATERMVQEDLDWWELNPRAKIPRRFVESFHYYDEALKTLYPEWNADRRAEHIASKIGDLIGLSENGVEQNGKRWRKLVRSFLD